MFHHIELLPCHEKTDGKKLQEAIDHAQLQETLKIQSSILLTNFKANRPISDITEGTEFVTVYPDESGNPASGVKKVILCNGQFYYELREKRDELKRKVNEILI